MLVDIHTHNQYNSAYLSIINLDIDDAHRILTSEGNELFSVGLHPWYIDGNSPKKILELEKLLINTKIACIGECGLDKNSKAPLPPQIEIFRKQIELSEIFHKPLIIHCVGCFNELIMLRKEMNPLQLWIIHGFRGKSELAQQVLKSGCSLSFGEHYNEESVRLTPIDKLFIETDESSLSIDLIYKNIASVKNINSDEINAGSKLLEQITGNPSQI